MKLLKDKQAKMLSKKVGEPTSTVRVGIKKTINVGDEGVAKRGVTKVYKDGELVKKIRQTPRKTIVVTPKKKK